MLPGPWLWLTTCASSAGRPPNGKPFSISACRPAAASAAVASAAVRPTRNGTRTWRGGSAPLLTTSVTRPPPGRAVPAAGSVRTTVPTGAVALYSRALPDRAGVRPASRTARSASATGVPAATSRDLGTAARHRQPHRAAAQQPRTRGRVHRRHHARGHVVVPGDGDGRDEVRGEQQPLGARPLDADDRRHLGPAPGAQPPAGGADEQAEHRDDRDPRPEHPAAAAAEPELVRRSARAGSPRRPPTPRRRGAARGSRAGRGCPGAAAASRPWRRGGRPVPGAREARAAAPGGSRPARRPGTARRGTRRRRRGGRPGPGGWRARSGRPARPARPGAADDGAGTSSWTCR